jgi:8-oxo-dGTP pyrophosphatase MutT (NUDIX family)
MEKKRIIAAGGLVINGENKLLMIFRRGFWDLPKGKLDDGETIEACAIREVQEETGVVDIELGDFITITYHEYFDTYLQLPVVKESHWYAMKVKGSPTLIPQTAEDITDIEWVDAITRETYLQKSYPSIQEVARIFF